MRSLFLRLCAATLGAGLASSAAAQTTTMIVMDGSGSMWGQIDGRAKLEIARETAAEALAGLPEDRVLGLMAYGHRRRGDCSDIEVLVPPAAGGGASILEAVNAMRFQGKTPLTEAVRQAAAALRSTEEPATVVLVTDGIETCEADPCALAAELEASGVDFTAHVIGFGLTRDEGAAVACIAENTGGRYIQASDAEALTEALAQTVGAAETPAAEAPPEPEPEEASRHFPGDLWMPGFSIGPTGRSFGPALPQPAAFDFPGDGSPEACRALCEADGDCGSWRYEPIGSYFVDHARCFAFSPGTEFRPDVYPLADGFVSGMKPGVVGLTTLYVPIGGEATASLTLIGPVVPGEDFTVFWSGPAGAEDWVDLTSPSHPDLGGDLSRFFIAETIEPGDKPEGAGILTAPAEPGLYELRYVFGRSADPRVIFTLPLPVGIAAPAPQISPVRISVPAEFEAEPISWSAEPVAPAAAPEAVAMPEAILGPWEAALPPGRWRIEGLAESGMIFAAEIEVAEEGPQTFEIPIGFESEGMGEDAPPPPAGTGTPTTDAATGLSFALPPGWAADEPFFAETAAGVASKFPSVVFTGPEGRMLALNPLRRLESDGSCHDSAAGPLCVFGAPDPETEAAMATILPSLSMAAARPDFGGAPFKPQDEDPLSTLVPGWSAP